MSLTACPSKTNKADYMCCACIHNSNRTIKHIIIIIIIINIIIIIIIIILYSIIYKYFGVNKEFNAWDRCSCLSMVIRWPLTSHLSLANSTVSNMDSYNRQYPIHSLIMISTFSTGNSISSILPLIRVITTRTNKIIQINLKTFIHKSSKGFFQTSQNLIWI